MGVLSYLTYRCKLIAASREPDVVIKNTDGSDYLARWHVIPRNKLFNIYLHHFMHPDDDRALHDHPWVNMSILLQGNYKEVVPVKGTDPRLQVSAVKERKEGAFYFGFPTSCHRVDLHKDDDGNYIPVWTLFITGPNVRTWGFWCKRGWIPWKQFVVKSGKTNTSVGCGE